MPLGDHPEIIIRAGSEFLTLKVPKVNNFIHNILSNGLRADTLAGTIIGDGVQNGVDSNDGLVFVVHAYIIPYFQL